MHTFVLLCIFCLFVISSVIGFDHHELFQFVIMVYDPLQFFHLGFVLTYIFLRSFFQSKHLVLCFIPIYDNHKIQKRRSWNATEIGRYSKNNTASSNTKMRHWNSVVFSLYFFSLSPVRFVALSLHRVRFVEHYLGVIIRQSDIAEITTIIYLHYNNFSERCGNIDVKKISSTFLRMLVLLLKSLRPFDFLLSRDRQWDFWTNHQTRIVPVASDLFPVASLHLLQAVGWISPSPVCSEWKYIRITVWNERIDKRLDLCILNMQTVRRNFLSRIDTIDCNIEYVKCHASRFIRRCFTVCNLQRD